MCRRARRSGLVMGFDTHMIAGEPCLPLIHSAHSPDHRQPDKPALCRGPGQPQGPGKVAVCTECPNLPVVGIWLLAWTNAGLDQRGRVAPATT
jgi:hypothetical protein